MRRLLVLWDAAAAEDEGFDYDWEDVGADSVIGATISFASRRIRQLVSWDDVIWLGHGDISDTTRPLRPRYFNPADDTFNTITGQTAGWNTDDLARQYVDSSNQLWFPMVDPTSTQDYAIATDKATVTLYSKTPPDNEHIWCVCEFGGDLYMSGSDNGADATIWQSTDGGANWTIVYQPGVANQHWFTLIFPYDGKIWTQGYRATGTGAQQGIVNNAFSSSDGSSWSDAGFQLWTRIDTRAARKAEPYGGDMLILSGASSGNSGQLYRFDGTDEGTRITDPEGVGGFVADFCLNGTDIYVASYQDNKIWKSEDGVVWEHITTCPTASIGSSILVYDNTLYVGTDDSHLWRCPLPEPEIPSGLLDEWITPFIFMNDFVE